MSANNLDSTEILMLDNFPGIPNVNAAGPYNLGNVAAGGDQNWYVSGSRPPHVLGTKFMGYQEGGTGIVAGSYTLIYLKTGTELSGTSIAVKRLCAMTLGPGAASSSDLLYTVTNDPTTPIGLLSGQCAVAMSAMTSGGYYGWFWCGGVCPESICVGMAGAYETDANCVKGAMVAVSDTEINFGTHPANSAVVPVAICLAADDN